MKCLLLSATLLALCAHAQDFSGSRLPSDREIPSYVLGFVQERWTGGQVAWYYNPANQPTYLATADVLNAINTAAARWAGMCKLTFTYMGTTTAVPNVRSTADTIDRISVFGWGALTDEMSIYGAYAKWWYDANHAMTDADIVINTARTWTVQNVEAIMTHELGHALGLVHSNVQATVMFANPYNSYSYQRTLRGDDAEACAALYGASPDATSNRGMNWAEQAYPQIFTPSPAASGSYGGYNYRYYPGTKTYLGTQNGSAFTMDAADGVIREQGVLSNFTGTVHGAGF